MKIYVLTQEDAFYIPVMLDHLLAARRDVVGVAIVPGELRPGHLRRYVTMMGPRDFTLQSANLAAHKALDVASRVLPLPRSYSVAGAARRAGVSVEHVAKVNEPGFVESLRARGVELIVSIACPQVLKPPILAVPTRGCINIHGALLPRYQGLLPSFWVLAKGERETGVTVHYIDEKIDHGGIILQRRVAIEPGDTVHSLVRRSKIETGKHLLVEAIARIERGEATPSPMDQAAATYYSYPDRAALREFRSRGRRFI
jgi:methionyl-tRNA formyltransferase